MPPGALPSDVAASFGLALPVAPSDNLTRCHPLSNLMILTSWPLNFKIFKLFNFANLSHFLGILNFEFEEISAEKKNTRPYGNYLGFPAIPAKFCDFFTENTYFDKMSRKCSKQSEISAK